jgi:hypothetical protein
VKNHIFYGKKTFGFTERLNYYKRGNYTLFID